MNIWTLYKKPQDTFRQRIQKAIFEFINIDKSYRSLLSSAAIILNYALSYLIVFFLIMQSLAREFINRDLEHPYENPLVFVSRPPLPSTPMSNHYFQVITILLLIRLSFGLVYIITQKVYFLIINKTLLIVNIFLTEYESTKEDFIPIEMPLFLIETLMIAVWAYKIERRIRHFDSRLHCRYPFLKEFTVYCMAMLMRRVQKMTFSVVLMNEATQFHTSTKITLFELQSLIIIVVGLSMMVMADYSDFLYNSKFKRILLSMDGILMILLFSWIILHIAFKQIFAFYHYLALMATMIFLMFLGIIKKEDYKKLYTIEARYLQYQSETFLLEYFETLRKLVIAQDLNKTQANMQMIKFIQFHRLSCLYTICPMTQRFNIKDQVEVKSQLIQEYLIKQIQNLLSTKPILKKYLIHYLSPKDKVYRYLNETNSYQKNLSYFHRKQEYVKRQLFRLAIQKKDSTNQIKILSAQTIKTQILSIIEDYLISAKRFYSILSKQIINSQNLLLYGNKMLKSIEEIQKLKEINNVNFTQGARLMINNFTSRLLQYPKTSLLQTVIDPPFLIQKTTQSCPTFLISAQPQNFLSIIDANIACTKEFYVKREDFVKLTVIDLLPEQIKARHLAYFNKVVKKIQFGGTKIFPNSLFIHNSLGYATFFRADIYSFYSIKGRIWCVAVQIFHRMKAIVLIAKQGNGKIMGISQMAVFHGFKLGDNGKQLTQDFFQRILTKGQGSTSKYKRTVVQAYEKIFENDEFHFMETKSMQIIDENTAFGFTYYLVQIRSIQNIPGSRESRLSLSQSILTKQLKSYISITEQEAGYQPKHQFHYHSDGVVRLHQQDQDDLLTCFNELAPVQQNQELELEGQLGKDIVQMRLINDQLDFLQNIEQQQQFQSKPMTKFQRKQNQLGKFNLKDDFFKQCLQNRQQELPRWLFYTRIVFIIVAISFLMSLIFIYVRNTIEIEQIDTQAHIISNIADNQLKLLQLSKILLAYKFYITDYLKSISIREFLAKVIAQYEQNSKFMNDLDPSIANYFSTGALQTVLSRYFIAFNNILTISQNSSDLTAYNQQPILKDITQKIVSAYNHIVSMKLSQFLSDLSMQLKVKVILIFLMDIITILIWVWTIFLLRHTQKVRNNLIWLISKIPDKFIDKQIIKLALFEEYLHFNKDIYCEDDLEYIMKIRQQLGQQKYEIKQSSNRAQSSKMKIKYKRKKALSEKLIQDNDAGSQHKINISQKKIDGQNLYEEQENSYIKKVIHPNKVNFATVFAFLWTVVILILNSYLFYSIQAYSSFSQQIVLLEQNLHKIQSNSDTMWILLNKFPYNQTDINFYKQGTYNSQGEFKAGLIKINRMGGFTQDFIQKTQSLWLSNCCQYIADITPNCSGELKGALRQGANQITGYINRKYDYLVSQSFTTEEFHNLYDAKTLSNLQLHYFPQIKSLNQQWIIEQHRFLRDKYQRVFFAYFVVIILCFAVIGVIYKLISRENESLIKVEQFFKLIEFDSLKNVKEFKLYIKETYYDKIFK